MAYHNIHGLAADRSDLFSILKTFLVDTVGWALHDDQPGSNPPYFVVMSTGESGQEDIYLRFLLEANKLAVRGCQYWDPSTHTPVRESYHSSTYIYAPTSSQTLYWFYADLDHIFIVTKEGASYYGHYSGLLRRHWSSESVRTQQAVSAGSNVVIPVNASLQPGRHYLIQDKANLERVLVTDADPTGNTLTIESLSSDYSAEAKIGEDPPRPPFMGAKIFLAPKARTQTGNPIWVTGQVNIRVSLVHTKSAPGHMQVHRVTSITGDQGWAVHRSAQAWAGLLVRRLGSSIIKAPTALTIRAQHDGQSPVHIRIKRQTIGSAALHLRIKATPSNDGVIQLVIRRETTITAGSNYRIGFFERSTGQLWLRIYRVLLDETHHFST